MNDAFLIFEQIGIMFLLILVGYVMFKIKVITDEGVKQLSEVLLTIVMPALVISVCQIDVTPQVIKGLLWSFLLSAISMITGIFIARICIKDTRESYRVYRMCVGYSNCAFVGIPLIDGLYGAAGVLYLTAYIMVFNLFSWTHGIMLTTDEKSFKGLIKVIKNPIIVALSVGVIMLLTGIRVPKIVASTLDYMKALNTPIAMFVAGATMAKSDLLKAIKNVWVLIPIFFKLLVVPAVVMVIYKLLPVPSEMVFTSNIIATACPTATIATLFAIRYNRNAVRASEIFSLSTLLSGITLPLMVMMSNWMYGLF